jgi:hypothetical protein
VTQTFVPVPDTAPRSAFSRPSLDDGSQLVYSPNRFYVRATDERGHHDRVSFKAPPELINQIAVLIGSDDFPDYRSSADFWRDAGLHHLHRRTDDARDMSIREGAQETIQLLAEQNYSQRIIDFATTWEKIIEQRRAGFSKLFQHGAWHQLFDLIEGARRLAQGDSEPWQSLSLALCDEWQDKIPAGALREIEAANG